MSKQEKLNHLKESVMNCKKCNLNITRINPVFGEGKLNAKIMLIGEAPGRNEDSLGKPFVGRAGKILDEVLGYIGLNRNNIYICNIIKCRPPKNRIPSKIEIKMCSPYIDKQIEYINPKVIAPMGRIAISYFFKKYELTFDKINEIHGKIYSVNNLKIIPIYHPAAVIYNNKLKKVLFMDFEIIIDNI
jgi:DNA polymerase